jgi:hypothetical protein
VPAADRSADIMKSHLHETIDSRQTTHLLFSL